MQFFSKSIVRFVMLLPKARREKIEKKRWYAMHRKAFVLATFELAQRADPGVKLIFEGRKIVDAYMQIDNRREGLRSLNIIRALARIRQSRLQSAGEEEAVVIQ